MTNIDINRIPSPSGKTEAKVKAATWATFSASLLGTTLLEWTSTDLIPALPASLNWLGPVLLTAVATASTFAAGYVTRSKPDSLSDSTVDAIKKWLRDRMPTRHAGGAEE